MVRSTGCSGCTVVDNGESGTGKDVFAFETEDGYVRAGVLTESDIQVDPLDLTP